MPNSCSASGTGPYVALLVPHGRDSAFVKGCCCLIRVSEDSLELAEHVKSNSERIAVSSDMLGGGFGRKVFMHAALDRNTSYMDFGHAKFASLAPRTTRRYTGWTRRLAILTSSKKQTRSPAILRAGQRSNGVRAYRSLECQKGHHQRPPRLCPSYQHLSNTWSETTSR